jgi:hypothetical protein
MSEEYCKSACQECNGRISLPVDAVGVEFNCPHCGVNLQLVLKHYCEHCNGPLSFEGNPDAIGMEIECGHCKNQTVLQPSALVIEDKEAAAEEVYEEEYDESDEGNEGDEEEYDEEYEEEEYEEEEAEEEAEPEPKRGGPPKPRSPKRGGPPKPRQPKKIRQRPGGGGTSPGDGQEKIGRRLAGSGAKPAEEESVSGGRPGRPKPAARRSGRPNPKRHSRPAGETQSAVPSAPMTRRQPAGTPEESMDPMSGAVPGGGSAPPPSPAGPQPGPVVRKVAGVIPGAGGGAPKFESSLGKKTEDTDEEFDGPWHKNPEKQKLAIVVTVFVLSFTYFGLASLAGLIHTSWGPKVEHYVKLKFIFGDDYRNNNVAESVQVDAPSLSISRETSQKTEGQQGPNVFYVTGSARNITGDTLKQVEIIFKLYDQSGTELGEALDYTNQLGPNVVWSFRAACMTSEAVSTNIFRAKLDRLIVQ